MGEDSDVGADTKCEVQEALGAVTQCAEGESCSFADAGRRWMMTVAEGSTEEAERRSIEVHVIARPDEDDEEFRAVCGGAGGSGVSVSHRALGCPRLG